jgi:hypothetical protein
MAMKKRVLLSTVLFCLSTSSSFAGEPQQQWKCYLELKSGDMHIAHYLVEPKKGKVTEQKLASLPIYAPDGVTKLKVKKLVECQPERREFNDLVARDMDKKQPR